MPSSLFEKRKPVCNGPKKVLLADRVFDIDTKTIQTKYANTWRKANELSGTALIGHLAKLVMKVPFVSSYIPAKEQVKSEEDHAFYGLHIRERQKMLEGELNNREKQPTCYKSLDRWDTFTRGAKELSMCRNTRLFIVDCIAYNLWIYQSTSI